MLRPDANDPLWLELSRELDWEPSYVTPAELFPPTPAGNPELDHPTWRAWDEPFKTSFAEYVEQQSRKNRDVEAVREAIGRRADRLARLDPAWASGLKLHLAVLPLAEFAAVIGNLRSARFGRTAAWRTASLLGALDELRHAQIPLGLAHDLLPQDSQFDFSHRFYHSNNWVAVAARRLVDEMLVCSDPVEFAVATHFVFETGFTNLQFVALAAVAHQTGDSLFEKVLTSIQSDEARHAQIGEAVLQILVQHDPKRVQRLVDKWFWRSWLLFAVITGFTMDYLTPVEHRRQSFKAFVDEWILEQFLDRLAAHGLAPPWYFDEFLRSLDHYHHMVYASAYTYRATTWFDMVLPGPRERAWLREQYPDSFPQYEPVWAAIQERWEQSDPGLDMGVHGTAIVGFCGLCQLVLAYGTPSENQANVLEYRGEPYVFCSPVCRAIFEDEPERYAGHKDLVKRVLAGEAPGNLLAFLRFSGLTFEDWGKDAHGGDYDFLRRARRS